MIVVEMWILFYNSLFKGGWNNKEWRDNEIMSVYEVNYVKNDIIQMILYNMNNGFSKKL